MAKSCNHVGEIVLSSDGFPARIVGRSHSSGYIVVIEDGHCTVQRNVSYEMFCKGRLASPCPSRA